MVCFKYIPTEDNPADMAQPEERLLQNCLLPFGGKAQEWPNWNPPVSNVDFDTECKGNKIFFETKLITAEGSTIEKQVQLSIGNLINEEGFLHY